MCAESKKTKLIRRLRWLLARIVLMVVVPLVIFIAAELVFAAMGWFSPIRLLQKTTVDGVEYVYTNPRYGQLFLPRRDIPVPSPIWVTRQKQDGVFRVVLLGESSAAGFPVPDINLARMIEYFWMDRYPYQPIEVVNLTMVAVNSHILRLMSREAMTLNPDAVVLYAGHNEVIGPYGPTSVFGRFSSMHTVRFNLMVRNLRIGRAMEWLYRKLAGIKRDALPRWGGLDEFRDVPVARDDPRLERLATQIEGNFKSMIEDAHRNRARVVVCLPAVNLTDWPPLASAPAEIDDQEAWDAWRREDTAKLTSAWQVYQMARRCEQEGDWDNAWPLYRLACDLDMNRFRADSHIRGAIQRLSGRWPVEDVQFLDTDYLMHEGNPVFLSDREYFFEHVHLSFIGRAMVTSWITEGLALITGVDASFGRSEISAKNLASRMMFTKWDEYGMWSSIWDLLSLSVFSAQPERNERDAIIAETMAQLRASLEQDWSIAHLDTAYQAAIDSRPDEAYIHLIAGRISMEMNDAQRAKKALERGLGLLPTHVDARLNLARTQMMAGDLEDVQKTLSRAARDAPEHPRLLALQGEYYARIGQYGPAREWLEKAWRAKPADYNVMVNLANVYLLLKDEVAAMNMFDRCLEVASDDAMVLNNYAWLLSTSPQASPEQKKRALEYIRRALAIRPGFHRYTATLALALAANGQTGEAVATAEKAIDEAMAVGDRDGISNLVTALEQKNINLKFSPVLNNE